VSEPLRILVVEDVAADAELALAELTKAKIFFVARRVETEGEYLAALEQFRPDLVLAAHALLQFDGMTALRLLQERELLIPFIFLTGSIGEDAAVECMKAGAADYVIKENRARLAQAVRPALERRDALERSRQAGAALQESEKRWQFALEGAGDGVWDWNAQTNQVFFSRKWKAMFGYTEEEIGDTLEEWSKRVHPDDLPGCLEDLERHFRGETPIYQNEHRVRCKDDSWKWILDRGQVIERTPDGKPLRVIGTHSDIIERKRTEEQLRTFSRMVEQSPVSVVLTDPAGNIEYVNPKFCELTGYSAQEVIGKNPRVLKSGQTPAAIYENLWRTLGAGEEWRGEFCNRKKSGELYWEDAAIAAVRDVNGTVTHLFAVKEDITARKQAAEVLQKTREQFLQSQKLEAIGQLAGGVAHDFNNLLSVIRGYTEILLARIPPEDATHHTLETIRHAADRAAGLTRQLLAFSRRQVLEPKVVDLGVLLEDMGDMLRRLIGEDINLIVTRPAELAPIKIDPGQFEQVVLNLAVNSRDAMPAGGTLRLELSVVELDEQHARDGATIVPGRYVLLSVSDTGCGMTPQVRARIFEPFYTTKERGRGSGLGLSTVYGIVKQSDGYVWADSEPGQGTRLSIYLPCVDEPVEPRSAPPQHAGELGHGEVILVVEDDAFVRGLAAEALGECGYHVLVAPDGDQAIRLAQEYSGPIELVLTDVILPGMNGRQVAERLTQSRPDLRVLFMSGYTDDVIARASSAGRTRAWAAGSKLLQKPFTLESLASGVREALQPGPRASSPG
jgi:two-component system cell cycle sensor histidine kinase/response regulator CckA